MVNIATVVILTSVCGQANGNCTGECSGSAALLQIDGSRSRVKCPGEWTDSMHFDCQLYEGANWCTDDGLEGFGWCDKSKKCDGTKTNRGGYALTGDQRWGWGDFKHFKDTDHPLTAAQVCAGCGSPCPAMAPKRKLNTIPEGCMDYPAANRQIWRGPSGYSCGAYHAGNFCVKTNGKWKEGPLMEGYGALTQYKNWALVGPRKRMIHPLKACCACGGGCDCTNGWKPASGSPCVREFEYMGKAYSGCTMHDNVNGKAWCSHNVKHMEDQWSECIRCASGWKQMSGSSCVGEFTYGGKHYSGCTMADHTGKAWCAYDKKYRGNRWSNCVRCR